MHLFKMKLTTWHNNELAKKQILLSFRYMLVGIIYIIWYRLTHIGIPCLFYKITGLYCPGCGITRMFMALICFEFEEAFRSNCLALILLPYGIFIYARNLVYVIITGQACVYKRYQKFIFIIILSLVIVYGFVRNIPYFDFLRI